MRRKSSYLFESILDNITSQDNTSNATNKLVSKVNDIDFPDPYVDTNYDFELFIDTPNIKARKRENIVSVIRKWTSNLDAVMETSRQVTAHTKTVFYSKYEGRLKDLVQDDDLIREPYDSNMYGTGLFVRYNHRFTTASQILKFICQTVMCVSNIENLRDDWRGIIHLRSRYYKKSGNIEDSVLSYASNIVSAVIYGMNISEYQNIDATLMDTTKFAFNMLHKTQEYKYNVYNGIRERLCPGRNLAEFGAYRKIENVFGVADELSKKATEVIQNKSSFGIQSLLSFNPYRLVDYMIFPFQATYVLKDLEYDGGYEEYELSQQSSYGNGRKQIQNQLIEHNNNSTLLSIRYPELYYTEWNTAKTKQGLKVKVSFMCDLGTVEMFESGCSRICDVAFLMEIQADSMFQERLVVFLDYLSRILNLDNEELDIIRKEIISKIPIS